MKQGHDLTGLYPTHWGCPGETAGCNLPGVVDTVGFAKVMSLSPLVSSARASQDQLSVCSLKPGCALLGAENSLVVEGIHGTCSGLHEGKRQTIWTLPVSIR